MGSKQQEESAIKPRSVAKLAMHRFRDLLLLHSEIEVSMPLSSRMASPMMKPPNVAASSMRYHHAVTHGGSSVACVRNEASASSPMIDMFSLNADVEVT